MNKNLILLRYLEFLQDPRKNNLISYHKAHAHLIEKAQGSSLNHQAWKGGYIDHISHCFYLVEKLYSTLENVSPLPFKKDSAFIVMYFHDIEKIFKYGENRIICKKTYLNNMLQKQGIFFSEEEMNALKYTHGEGGDYTNTKRVMNELAAFCHVIDTISARIWFSEAEIIHT